MKNKNKFNRFLTSLPAALLLATTGAHATNDGYGWETTRVSVSSRGEQGNGGSISEGNGLGSSNAISADGRYVAFSSDANNLVAGDSNNATDVFVHDRKTGKTTLVSINSAGEQGNAYSASNAISADGRYVAFSSDANNLIAGDTNGKRDIFVHDRKTGKTTSVSNSVGEQRGCSSDRSVISADGRYVAFRCGGGGTVVFLYDRKTGETTQISSDATIGSISGDGRYVAYNSFDLCRLPDPNLGLVSIGFANVYDRVTGMSTEVSGVTCGFHSFATAISPNGRYVAFSSDDNNLVAGDTNGVSDAFVRDRVTGKTARVSVSSKGGQGNAGSSSNAISTDGRYVTFSSDANNLVAGDSNNATDVFVHDRKTGKTTLVSVNSAGKQGNNASSSSAISADGRNVAFSSDANNLVARDTNGVSDVFVRDRGDDRNCGSDRNCGDH